ncbi:hypothetical protein HBA55_10130 [Pseudomaricurvus alkylphenolicus]|uniref:hypothetical protein n=1 Tax=Pseudomaricurvus alkylphenolicus TaxID=1306991 RepID=UPI0014243AF8|nr:hypothetical protein [Pseudomaricurvus alkylphenolicus]NIB39945.1 hypothetical protein [Pseudomaricurvus alkylphenolicus]
MNSIGSQGITNVIQSLHSRKADEPRNADASAKLASSQRLSSQTEAKTEPTNFLSNRPQNLATDHSAKLYTHLERELTREQLDLTDIRATLARVQDYAGDTNSFKGILTGDTQQSQNTVALQPHQSDGGREPDNKAANSGKLFSLTVTTADGDQVEIEINKGHGDDETTITFKVDGELDLDEQEALTKLTNKLGALADNYRSDAWVQMGNLDAFDHTELTGFSLQVKGASDQIFKLQYTIDENAGYRSLSSNLNGYNFNIRVDLDGLKLDPDIATNHQYQQYLDLISETAHAYRQGEDAGGESTSRTAVFFLEGMNAVFGVDHNTHADDATATSQTTDTTVQGEAPLFPQHNPAAAEPFGDLTTRNQKLIDNFTSGLPDFIASFDTPVFRPNPDQPMEISTLSLDIRQITEITSRRDDQHRYTNINQRSEYESRVSQHLGLAGDSVEHANLAPQEEGGQSYLYRTDIRAASIERSMTFEDRSKLIAVDQIREQEHIRKEKLVVGGEIERATIEDLSAAFKNVDQHYSIANTPAQQRQAEKFLNDYRTIEQLNDFMDGNKVELFL